MSEIHHGPPPEPEIPYRDKCPQGCEGGSGGIEWLDGKEHREDTRCWVCGFIWKQGEGKQ